MKVRAALKRLIAGALRIKRRRLNNLVLVARWRYIQTIHEPGELRNPDTLVRHFLPARERWKCRWLGKRALAILRSDPFYYYLVARTRHYDGVFLEEISRETRQIINIGCGTDTRSFRFAGALKRNGITVLECDQPEVIADRLRRIRRWGARDHVEFMPIDLNDGSWPRFDQWLDSHATGKTLVMMEGVSPYVDAEAFRRFLGFLAKELPRGSRVAYDYKFRGVEDDMGRGGRTREPFRLPSTRDEIATYHAALGYRVASMEESAALSSRLLSNGNGIGTRPFSEDGLIVLDVA